MTFPSISSYARVITTSFCLFLILLSATNATEPDSAAPAPGTYTITNDNGRASFPFEIYRGDIRYEAKVNGHDVHLLLDDGFMWDQLLFWGQPKVDSLGMVYDGEIAIGDGNDDEAMVPARTASGVDVSLPGVEITDQDAVITAYSSGTASMWSGSVGQLSGAFLKQFVVDINFDNMTLTLIEPERFEYTGNGVAVPWTPMEVGTMSIPGTLELPDGRTVTIDMLVDLGYNRQLEITATGENKITPPTDALSAGLGSGIQGIESRGRVGRIPSITIGGYKVTDVISSFLSEDHSDQAFSEVMIGLGLLSRFNLVYDYSHNLLYMEPNASFNDSYEYDMSGMSTRPGGRDFRVITVVHPNSPASEAGLQAGDQVTEINGRPVADYDTFELLPLFRQESTTVELQIRRADVERTVRLVLRKLL